MILFGYRLPWALWFKPITIAASVVMWGALAAQAEDSEPLAAMVNGESITRTEILLAMELLPPQFRQLPPEQLYPLIREQLIDIKLLAARGAALGLHDDSSIAARVKFYEMRLQHDYYAREIVENYLDQELIDERYQKLLDNFSQEEELKVSHILVATEEKAEEVAQKLEDGDDFVEVARQYSVGPSGPKGGELGYIRRAQVVPEFAEAAFDLDDGEISDPIKTQFGWHVILVTERRVPKPPKFAEVEDKLRAEIAERLLADAAKEERLEAEIELFDMDEGFFGDGELVQ